MITFEHFPEDKICPICGKKEDFPCTLLPIDGTDDGDIYEVIPVHEYCLDGFRYNRAGHIIYKMCIIR